MLQNLWEGSLSSFFTHVLSQTLAVLAVSIKDKEIHNAFQLWLVSIFLDCCGCEYTKKNIFELFSLSKSEIKKYGKATYM